MEGNSAEFTSLGKCYTLTTTAAATPTTQLHTHHTVTHPPHSYTPTTQLHTHHTVTHSPHSYTPTTQLHTTQLHSPHSYTLTTQLHTHHTVTHPPHSYTLTTTAAATPTTQLHTHHTVTHSPHSYTLTTQLHTHHTVCTVSWLLPSNTLQHLKDGSAQTVVHAATLRHKLQIKLTIPSSHSRLTPGRPVPRICSDSCTSCHTERQVANQIYYLT